jgi:hypothetical protein
MFHAPVHEIALMIVYDLHAEGEAWLIIVFANFPEDSAGNRIIVVA